MSVLKYGSRRRDGCECDEIQYGSRRRGECIQILKREAGWLDRYTKAGGRIAVPKYSSNGSRRDGCTEIRKQEEGCLYRNMEEGMAVQKYESRRRDSCAEIWKQEEGWLY
jgi:hypothetical protein